MDASRDLTARRIAGQPDDAGGGMEQVRVRILPDGRMDRENAARYLGHNPKTLAHWQLEGKGPRSVRVGGRRFYFKRDLDDFIHGEA
jgi:hypothetical protein